MAAADPVVLVLQVEGDGEGEGRKGRPAAVKGEKEWLSLLALPGRVEGVITGTPALASRPCKEGIDEPINICRTHSVSGRDILVSCWISMLSFAWITG